MVDINILKEFGNNLIPELEKLNSEFKYSITEYEKNNKHVVSLCVDYNTSNKNDMKICPQFPLDYYYSFLTDNNLNSVVEKLYEDIVKNKSRLNLGSLFNDIKKGNYQKFKDNIYIKVLSIENNEELLNSLVYKEYAGVAMVPYILFSVSDDNETGTANITKAMFDEFRDKPTEDELFETALLNTKKYGFVFNNMLNIILTNNHIDFSPTKFYSFINENGYNNKDFILITNKSAYFGAAFICYKEYLHTIANALNTNLYIIPSSINEVLIMSETNLASKNDLISMVTDINNNSDLISTTDILGSFVWHYNKDTMELTFIKE